MLALCPLTGVLTRERKRKGDLSQTQRREGHVYIRQILEWCSYKARNTKHGWQLPETKWERGKETLLWSLETVMPAHTVKYVNLCEASQGAKISYSSPKKLIKRHGFKSIPHQLCGLKHQTLLSSSKVGFIICNLQRNQKSIETAYYPLSKLCDRGYETHTLCLSFLIHKMGMKIVNSW